MQMCFPVRCRPSWVFQLLQNLSNLHHVKQVHAQIFKANLHQNPHTAPKLIAAFSRCRQLPLAVNIFNHVRHPNVYLYNTIIRAHAHNAQSSQALALFIDMKANGVYPDHCTFPFLLKACSGNSWLRVVKMIHAQLEKFGFSQDIFVSESLFFGYNNCGVTAILEVPMLIKRSRKSVAKLFRVMRPAQTFEKPIQLDLNHAYVEANLPDGLLSVSLLRHQKTGLAWMLQQESSNFQGGILADDQGLGKTISMIALIQMQRSLQSKFKSEHLDQSESKSLELHDDEYHVCCSLDIINKTEESNLISTTGGGTLMVCPPSILQQWYRELDEKVPKEAKLSVLVYHGGSRTRNPEEVANYDVVLTTYHTVTNEVPIHLHANIVENKRKRVSKRGKNGRKGLDSSSFDCGSGPLARVKWFRVILDEAHTIKNPKTKVAKACCGLQAENRWCLSGTPLQNVKEDLYSYFRFLKISTFRNSDLDYKELHSLLRDTMLRRTKVYLIKLEFSSQERAIYDKLEARSCSQFKAYDTAGEVDKNYLSILGMLTRLRRACDHLLLNEYYSDYVANDSVAMASTLPTEKAIKFLEVLENSEAICRVCNDLLENPVVTMCGHVFCYQCVSENMMCPASECNEQVGPDVVFSKSTLINYLFKDLDGDLMNSQLVEKPLVVHKEHPSSKLRVVNERIQSLFNLNSPNDGPIKIIIFSQWIKMLDLIGNALDEHSIQHRRLDGTMTLTSRDTAVKEFNTDPQVTIMLMSLKAGNLGLNMVAACHVILFDPWWNPTTEDQAVDRTHRIGQTRPVTVDRLIIKDTIEERVLVIQEKKRKMIASAFNEDYCGGSAVVLSREDLRYLFLGTKPRDSP